MIRTSSTFAPILLIAFFLAVTLAAARCPAGSARLDSRNPKACLACPPGTFRTAWQSDQSCKSCAPGTFQPYRGATHISQCRWCPRNSYSSSSASSSCTPCPSGRSSGYGATSCVKCSSGQVASFFGNSCRTCPSFTYVTSVETTADGTPIFDCVDCPHGTYSPPGSTSIAQCLPCQKGQPCYSCPPNTYFVPTGECKSCPPGTQSLKGATSIVGCTPCPKNSARSAGSKQACKKCSSGSSAPSTGSSACKTGTKCPTGTVLSTSSTCISCPPGSRLIMSAKGAFCRPCPSGSVSSGGLSKSCQACARGSVPDSTSSTCVCSAGQYLAKNGACVSCPAGTAQSELLHSYTGCEHCDTGTVAARGATRCTRCPDGLVADPSQSKCVKCPSNSMPDLLTETDLLEGRGHSKCVSTSTGCSSSTAMLQGSRKYSYCEPIVCAPGTPSSKVGKACEGCAAGEYVTKDWSGNLYCEVCPADSTTAPGVFSSCKKCPNGTMRDEDNGNKCTCSGLYSLGFGMKNGKCLKCSPGTYSTFKMNQCSPCKAGTFAPKSGAWRCFKCPPGTTSMEGMSSCTK